MAWTERFSICLCQERVRPAEVSYRQKKLKDKETEKYIYLFISTMIENNNCPKLSIKTNIYVSPSSHFCWKFRHLFLKVRPKFNDPRFSFYFSYQNANAEFQGTTKGQAILKLFDKLVKPALPRFFKCPEGFDQQPFLALPSYSFVVRASNNLKKAKFCYFSETTCIFVKMFLLPFISIPGSYVFYYRHSAYPFDYSRFQLNFRVGRDFMLYVEGRHLFDRCSPFIKFRVRLHTHYMNIFT